MNTRIIPKEYNYTAPQTLAEALDILKQKSFGRRYRPYRKAQNGQRGGYGNHAGYQTHS